MQRIILLFSLFLLTVSRRITPIDISLSPNNKDSLITFSLTFSLETSLTINDYIKLIFPIELKPPTSLLWSEMESTCETDVTQEITEYNQISPALFYIRFLKSNGDYHAPVAKRIYTITIIAELLNSGIPAGIKGPIKMYTVTTNQDNAIIIDSNPVFGNFLLGNQPEDFISFSVSVDSSVNNKTKAGYSYPVNIDFSTDVPIFSSARVVGTLSNPQFRFDYCFVKDEADTSVFPTPYFITYPIPNQFVIFINESLLPGKYKIICFVRNPYPETGFSDFTLMTKKGYMDTIIELAKASNVFESSSATDPITSQISWSVSHHYVRLGWGVPASEAATPEIFAIYKDSNSDEKWYQSIKIEFRPSTNLENRLHRIEFYTINDPGLTILKNSIQHNLPAFSANNPISCSISIGFIKCTGVGQLVSSQSYYLAFRFNLADTASAMTAEFGKIDLYIDDQYDSILISDNFKTLTHTNIKTNKALYVNDGIIAYTKTKDDVTTHAYIHAGDTTNLYFTFKYFSRTIVDIDNPNNRGIEFYTSNSLPSVTEPECKFEGITSSEIYIENCEISSKANYSLLRFRIVTLDKLSSNVQNLFPSPGPGPGTIIFKGTKFNGDKLSSLSIIDENIYDFYGRWVTGFSSSTSTVSTSGDPFFFNSLVFKANTLQNLQITSSFFSVGNTGESFPTLIRIAGSLTTTEASGVDKLLVFFNNLVPLGTDSLCYGSTNVKCTYKTGELVENTHIDSRTIYIGSRYLEIEMDSFTSDFNIYVPVSTDSTASIGFFIVTATKVNTTLTQQGIFKTGLSIRKDLIAYNTAPVSIEIGSSSTVELGFPSSPKAKVGEIKDIPINAPSSYLISSAPGVDDYGAGYGLCADYNFKTDDLAFTKYQGTLSSPLTDCVFFSYDDPGNSNNKVYCNICPVHTTMNSVPTLSNFRVPILTNLDALSVLYVVSDATGQLFKAVKDERSNVLDPETVVSYQLDSGEGFKGDYTSHSQKFTFKIIFAVETPEVTSIKLTPSTPSTSLQLTVSSTPKCFASLSGAICSPANQGADIIIDIDSNNGNWKTNTEYTFSFFVDPVGPATTIDFSVIVGVTIGGTFLPQQQAATPSSYQIVSDGTVPELLLDEIQYLLGATQGLATFSFAITIPKTLGLYENEFINCDLGSLALTNTDPNVNHHCHIRISGKISLGFSYCELNWPLIKLKAREDIDDSKLTVVLTHVSVPNVINPTGISCSLHKADNTGFASSPTYKLPSLTKTQSFLASEINLFNPYALKSYVANLELKTIVSNYDFDLQGGLYLYFPSYYSPTLGYDTFNCSYSNIPIECTLIDDFILKINPTTSTIPRMSWMKIKIFGVIFPEVPSGTNEQYYVAFDNDNNPTVVNKYGFIPNIPEDSFPLHLQTSLDFEINSKQVLTSMSFTFNPALFVSSIEEGTQIVIDFPNIFTYYLYNVATPKISFKNINSGQDLSFTSSISGGRVTIILGEQFVSTGLYQLVFSHLRTPDYAMCKYIKPAVTIVDGNDFDILYLSTQNSFDSSSTAFPDSPSLIDFVWKDTTGTIITNLNLNKGVYSTLLRITPADGNVLVSDIGLSLEGKRFVVSPSSIKAAKGAQYIELRIAPTDSLTSTNTYSIQFDINRNESLLYKNPPIITATIVSGKKSLPAYDFEIPRGGFSLPIVWDLDSINAIPRDDLNVTATILDPTDGNFRLITSASLIFTPTNYIGSFVFAADSSLVETTQLRVQYSISGTNANDYQLATPVVYATITSPVSTAPSLQTFTVTSQYSPIKQEVIINPTQPVNIYYYNVMKHNYQEFTCDYIKNHATIPPTYNSSDKTQTQFGLLIVSNPNQLTSFEITNLLSNTTYTLTVCVQNQGGIYSKNWYQKTYTTVHNGQGVYQISFVVDNPITQYQLAAICCYIANKYSLPPTK